MSWLTTEEVLALFHRSASDAYLLSSADAEEYLVLVSYLAARSVRRDAMP